MINSDNVEAGELSQVEIEWGWAIRECESATDGSAMYAVFDTKFPNEVLFFLPADAQQLDNFKAALNGMPILT
jgi:hypothetical protein